MTTNELPDLEDRTFVITGGARGLGAATGLLAARRGASVVISDVLDDDGEATAAAIRDEGGRAIYLHCDITDDDEVQRLMDGAAAEFGGIDVLHNNAGIHEAMIATDFSFEDMAIETFDRVIAVNLRGAFVCTKKALPYLKESTLGPSVINAGSTASFAGYPYGLAYGTSKGGIAMFTKNLAVALAPYGIRSNCYCPATVDTQMVKTVGSTIAGDDPEQAEAPDAAHLGAHLVRRIGDPVDVAELVCFLAGPRSSFVNGVTWLIDGGVLAWRDSVDALGMS
jgi:NAD(P)-dependent dehydrogenase (short-subunit alcohol dehydrogenase family)